MTWCICFLLATLVIFAELVLLLVLRGKFKNLKRIKIIYCLLFGVFLMGVFLHYPSFWLEFGEETHRLLKSVVYSVINAIRVFATEDMYGNISQQIRSVINSDTLSETQKFCFKIYELFVIIIQFIAPFLTFGFVASFIKNFFPGVVYKFFTVRRDVHVFSELNEKTLALANSILKDDEAKREKRKSQEEQEDDKTFKPLIVFTACDKKDDDDELIDKARNMGALIFRSAIDNIRFRKNKEENKEKRRKNRKITFYLTGEDENEKINYATNIIGNYDCEDVSMYVFSDGLECELLLSAWDNKFMKIFRVNDIQALIYHNLYTHGIRLFKKARETNGNMVSAVIVGLGKYGIETLKALAWYCQVPGFNIKITAFDADPNIESKFRAQCPELMEKNRDITPGEAHYDINIYGGIDVQTYDFFEKLKNIYDPTYVFVSLGNDEDNVSLATRIRSEYKRTAPKMNPDIETVVFNSDIAREMSVSWEEGEQDGASNKGITTYRGDTYDIHMIGDLESFYSVKTVIDSELIARGMEINCDWAKNDPLKCAEEAKKFWKYNYNYKSSIARAIYESLTDKLIANEYIADDDAELSKFEHIRWNAYMRGEGYHYSEDRIELAKTHNNLVPDSSLDAASHRKDERNRANKANKS